MITYTKLSIFSLCLSCSLFGMQTENEKLKLDLKGRSEYRHQIDWTAALMFDIDNWHQNTAAITYVIEKKRLKRLTNEVPLFDKETDQTIITLINKIKSQEAYAIRLSEFKKSLSHVANSDERVIVDFDINKRKQFEITIDLSLRDSLKENGVTCIEGYTKKPEACTIFIKSNSDLKKEAIPHLISAVFIPIYFSFVLRSAEKEYKHQKKTDYYSPGH